MGVRIADARSRAGKTQAQLASEVSLDRSAVTKIENGTRRVSAIELARIADALDARIEWFVEEAPGAIVSRRNVQEPGAPSPRIDAVVERAARNVEFALSHDKGFVLPSISPLVRPATADSAEDAAMETRRLLDLGPNMPLTDVAHRLASIGLLAFSLDLGSDAADAATILLRAGGVAVVNGHLQVGRRRLSIAHEIGHFVFADEYSVDWRIADQDDPGSWESRLDRFARALLLPELALRQSWKTCERRSDSIRTAAVRTASDFRVDMTTLSRRLLELGIIGNDTAASIRSVRTTRSDIIDLDLVVNDELAPPSLPRAYERSVLALYRNETIAGARAIDLLFDSLDEESLPALPSLPADVIWQFVS